MKYAIILTDGAADEPVEQLDGRTPLQAARTPNIDRIAAAGVVGSVSTVPAGFTPGSDVATLSVLGYDPTRYYTGRAPLEAAARDLPIGQDDVVFRCNLTTVLDGVMVDFSAGHITQPEAESLIRDLKNALDDENHELFTGVMYRHLMIIRNAGDMRVTCTPPHDIPDQAIDRYLPSGPDAPRITALMDRSRSILAEHEVNRHRRQRGDLPATTVWLWGQGKRPLLPDFRSRFGVGGACIAAVDLIRGIARLINWPILEVEGATGYLDTNYAGKGRRAVEALQDFDLICVHIEAPDEAGHNGDPLAKVTAIERIDEHIVGPLCSALEAFDEYRVLLLPDHPTPVRLRTHTAEPPPFCMAGTGIDPDPERAFDELAAARSGLRIQHGHLLMDRFMLLAGD